MSNKICDIMFFLIIILNKKCSNNCKEDCNNDKEYWIMNCIEDEVFGKEFYYKYKND